jgi:hypothetical protein
MATIFDVGDIGGKLTGLLQILLPDLTLTRK